jgi:type II secretory pathway component PulC
VLALLCLGLSVIVAAELIDAPARTAFVAAGKLRPMSAPSSDTGRVSMPPRSTYDEVVARPLFSDARRPSAFSAAAADANPAFVLVGTVLSRQERSALIRHGQPARVDHVVEGQSIDGWTVHSIASDRVVFTNAGASLTVSAKGATHTTAHPAPSQRRPDGPLSIVPSPLTKD